jgi:hypothetical protein
MGDGGLAEDSGVAHAENDDASSGAVNIAVGGEGRLPEQSP